MITMKRCIIITAYIEGLIRNITNLDDAYIICADGGYAKALAENIRPSILVGDFDSFDGVLPNDIPIIKVPTHKDDTDTDLALSHAMEKGYSDVILVGGIGGRLDHTIANIQNIVRYMRKGLKITMTDEQNKIFAIENDSIVIPGEKGKKLSLFAQGGMAEGVNVSGTEYLLNDFDLPADFPLGVSNEFTEDFAKVSVKNGVLLVVITSE